MNDSKIKSKSFLLTIIAIILLLIAVIGVSYAAFYYSKVGDEVNRISTGTITMSYSENNNGIYLTDAYPTTDAIGMALSGTNQYFDFTVSASMSGNTIVDYVVAGVKVQDNSTLPDEGVKVYLTSIDGNRESQVVAPTKIPIAATIKIVLKRATFEPIAEPKKFTASLLTPTTKSKVDSAKRNTTIPR